MFCCNDDKTEEKVTSFFEAKLLKYMFTKQDIRMSEGRSSCLFMA